MGQTEDAAKTPYRSRKASGGAGGSSVPGAASGAGGTTKLWTTQTWIRHGDKPYAPWWCCGGARFIHAAHHGRLLVRHTGLEQSNVEGMVLV